MVDAEVPLTAVAMTADLSQLGLKDGTAYTVTIDVAADGTQTATKEEIIPPIPQPTSDVVVFRHLKTGRAYLAQHFSDGWIVSFTRYVGWDEVMEAFPAPEWVYTEVIL